MTAFLAFTTFQTEGVVYQTGLLATSGALQNSINTAVALSSSAVLVTGTQSVSGVKTFKQVMFFDSTTINGLQGSGYFSGQYLGHNESAGYSIDLRNRTLAGEWSASALSDTNNGIVTVDINGWRLIDSNQVPSIDWQNRQLANEIGTIHFDWSTRSLLGGQWKANNGFLVTGGLRLELPVSTSATVGTASALPVLPAGYVTINVTGINVKMPYYNI